MKASDVKRSSKNCPPRRLDLSDYYWRKLSLTMLCFLVASEIVTTAILIAKMVGGQ